MCSVDSMDMNLSRLWTGKPGLLQSVGLQTVQPDLVTEQQQQSILIIFDLFFSFFFVFQLVQHQIASLILNRWYMQKHFANPGKLLIIHKLSSLFPWKSLSCVWLLATPWAVDCQAPLSIEFSRREYWSGLSFPFPGELTNPGIKPASPRFFCRQILYCLSHLGPFALDVFILYWCTILY